MIHHLDHLHIIYDNESSKMISLNSLQSEITSLRLIVVVAGRNPGCFKLDLVVVYTILNHIQCSSLKNRWLSSEANYLQVTWTLFSTSYMRGSSLLLLRCSLATKFTTNSLFFSCSQASVIFCLPAGQSFWQSFVHTFWLPRTLVLHARPLSGTHSRSLSLELSRW